MSVFVKGDPRINRKGRPPGKSEKQKLLEALEAEGEKRGEDFWARVAKEAYVDKMIMAAVCKKFIPDMSAAELSGTIEVIEMPVVTIDHAPLSIMIGDPLVSNN